MIAEDRALWRPPSPVIMQFCGVIPRPRLDDLP
jgi:hypothetical protein